MYDISKVKNSFVRLIKMKKIFGIVALSLLWFNLSYASCFDDIDMNVSQPSRYFLEIHFEILNNNNKSIEITEVRIATADNQIIKSYEPSNKILKPFGRVVIRMSISDVNKNIWKKSEYSCRYN